MSCGSDPYTYRECEGTSDCHQPTQTIPGAICTDGQCSCEDSSKVICCELGDDGPNCEVACRDCIECADGTPECPTYECRTKEDCESREALCPTLTECEQGKCVYTPYVVRARAQKEGDCAELYCTDEGTYSYEPDSSDESLLGNGCSFARCAAGKQIIYTLADGIGCTGGYCVGGRCVSCYRNLDCNAAANELCRNGKCVPAVCANSTLDGDESDLDCGGTACARCPDNQRCFGDSDCLSDVCRDQRCAPAAPEDGRFNGTETARDCGGPSAPPCRNEAACILHSDCMSGVCLRGSCLAPKCDDGTQNQGEDGPDCGGPCPLPCR
jgi:hypothetical protein